MEEVGVRFAIIKTIREMLGRTGEFKKTNEDGEACLVQSELEIEVTKGFNIGKRDFVEALEELTESGMIKSTAINNSSEHCVTLSTKWERPNVDSLKKIFA